MKDTLIEFEVDEKIILEANKICDTLGIDLKHYLNMCLDMLISKKSIPFELLLNDENKGIKAMKKAQKNAEENGLSNMTLEEINEEISKVRSE